MSKLLYAASMSLDGFIAGPGGDMSWLRSAGVADPRPAELMAEVGALLVGGNTWFGDDPNAGTDAEGAYGGQWHGPQIVLTHRAVPAEPGVTVFDDFESAVAAAKSAAGGKYVNILGADVARQCIDAGVLDEIYVFVEPVLLGDGVRLFDRPRGHRVDLQQLDVTNRPNATALHLRVVRP